MDSFWGLVLNGIFGLIFAIIGYKAVVKGAQIQANAERQKNQQTNSQQPEKSHFQTTSFQENQQSINSSLNEIHWSWWAIYISLGLGLWLSANIKPEVADLLILIIFLLLVVPASTIWVALKHPIRWKYSILFISIAYLVILIFALTSDLYVDLYEDVPLWAWTYANIGAVVVISIQREQLKKRNNF